MCFDDFDYNRKTCDKCGYDYDDREGCDCELTDNENCQVDLLVSVQTAEKNCKNCKFCRLKPETEKSDAYYKCYNLELPMINAVPSLDWGCNYFEAK